MAPKATEHGRSRLPRTVIVLGLVSFFNDLASEMVTPLIPVLLAGTLGAGAAVLGLIEGAADAASSFLKLWSGRRSDWLGGRRKGLALAGYTLSNAVRPLVGLASSWIGVMLPRVTDRVGKGIRSAPRDALIADTTSREMTGRAYGLHRAMDNAGAVAGSLLAAAILFWTPLPLPGVILLSGVPGAACVLLIAFGVREPKRQPVPPRMRPALPPLRWHALSAPMRRYLLVLALFTLARVSETFLVLRGAELGIGTTELLLLWAAYSGAKAVVGTYGGHLADRFGRAPVMMAGWGLLAASFLAFSRVESALGLWLVALPYGLFLGATEGAERALIGDYARPEERGTAFGWYYLVTGLVAVPAGVLFGGLWQLAGASVAFLLAGSLSAASAVLLYATVRRT